MKKLREIWNKIIGKRTRNTRPNPSGTNRTEASSAGNQGEANQEEVYTKRQLGQGRYEGVQQQGNIDNQEEVYTKRQLGQGRYARSPEQNNEGTVVNAGNGNVVNIDDLINQPARAMRGSLPSVLDDSSSTLSKSRKSSVASDKINKTTKKRDSKRSKKNGRKLH